MLMICSIPLKCHLFVCLNPVPPALVRFSTSLHEVIEALFVYPCTSHHRAPDRLSALNMGNRSGAWRGGSWGQGSKYFVLCIPAEATSLQLNLAAVLQRRSNKLPRNSAWDFGSLLPADQAKPANVSSKSFSKPATRS